MNSGTAGITFGAVTFTDAPTFHVVNPTAGGTTLLTLGAVTNAGFSATITGNGNVAQSAVMDGAGGLILGVAGGATYSGTTTLNRANTYTGETVVNSGTLEISTSGGTSASAGSSP